MVYVIIGAILINFWCVINIRKEIMILKKKFLLLSHDIGNNLYEINCLKETVDALIQEVG